METILAKGSIATVEADALAITLCEDEAAPKGLEFAQPWLDEMKASISSQSIEFHTFPFNQLRDVNARYESSSVD